MNVLRRRLCPGIAFVLFSLLITGCVTPVTPEQISSADYGKVPDTYQDSIKNYMQSVLIDPYSAHYRFFGEPQKAYAYISGTLKPPMFGHLVLVGINSKNRLGGYVGEQLYRFLVKDNNLWMLNEHTNVEAVR